MTMAGARVVAVTGSGSGIGRAIAGAFLRDGATVYGLDASASQEHPAPAATKSDWIARSVDVSSEAAVVAAFAEIESAHGGVDVLVANAAIGYPESFEEMPLESWERVLAVNLTGTMLCIRAALPPMRRRGSGSIVLVSSIAGRTKSVANGAHYTVSKYGQVGLTRHLAAELAGTGIRINCVAPGPTDTPALTTNASAEDIDGIREKTPLRRIGRPEDVANVVRFVADDTLATHMHGAVLDVNGGLY
jgi:NAD(P)-dependent dehydrogenase (short-subunit alcohol dehydrogenase family)